MRNPFRRRSVERVLEEAFRWIMIDLRSPDSELRNAIVRVARSETKNMFGQHLDTEVEKFDRILADRAERALAELGSAAPTPTSQLEREFRRAFTILERDHRLSLYALPAEKVCWNSACATQEPVPHMRDERDHRSIGEVLADEKAALTPKTCNYCGFQVIKSTGGGTCKSGDACPFSGRLLKFLTPPKENP